MCFFKMRNLSLLLIICFIFFFSSLHESVNAETKFQNKKKNLENKEISHINQHTAGMQFKKETDNQETNESNLSHKLPNNFDTKLSSDEKGIEATESNIAKNDKGKQEEKQKEQIYISDSSPYPVWPNQLEKMFLLVSMLIPGKKHMTVGKFYYHYDEKKEMTLLMNGNYDNLCVSSAKESFTDTPCANVIMNDRRYLIYPKMEHCCFCCDAEHGCGVTQPDWMYNAKFLEKISLKQHNKIITVNVWAGISMHPYLYFEKASEDGEELEVKQPLGLYLIPHTLKIFRDVNKLSEDKIKCNEKNGENTEKTCNIEELLKLEKVVIDIMNEAVPQWCNLETTCNGVCNDIQNGNGHLFKNQLLVDSYEYQLNKKSNIFITENIKNINEPIGSDQLKKKEKDNDLKILQDDNTVSYYKTHVQEIKTLYDFFENCVLNGNCENKTFKDKLKILEDRKGLKTVSNKKENSLWNTIQKLIQEEF